jgi:hypothetical protein
MKRADLRKAKQIRAKNTPDFLFAKFVEHVGELPRIINDPPLIFHRAFVKAVRQGRVKALMDA